MKKICVETNELGFAIRIFRTEKAAAESGLSYIYMDRKVAVSQIREQVWFRAKSECEWCSEFLTSETGHLHEMIHRGNGGEVSIANCVFICYKCHFSDFETAHGDRDTRYGELDSEASN